MAKTYNYFLKLLIFFFFCAGISAMAQSSTFNYTGALQTYVVPAGVTCVTFDARGASGGQVGPVTGVVTPTTPGNGGRVQGTLTVTAGETLDIRVGGEGADGAGAFATGGYNGGGNANVWEPTLPTWTGGAGGGASDIEIPPYGLATRQVVAAGGGGAGFNGSCTPGDQPGGDGGGTTGASATTCTAILIAGGYATVTPAGGGTSVGPGGGGVLCCGITLYTSGNPGTLGAGGDNTSGGGIGGGGGGGYYGGGGGCWTGGGGGSSYTNPVTTTGVINTPGFNTGNGVVIITASIPSAPGTINGPDFYCLGITPPAPYTNTTAGPGIISWRSSNTAVITIGSTTGLATPVAIGVANIICTVTNGCAFSTASLSVTVNSAPSPIVGTSSFCVSSTSTFTDASIGGVWSLSNTNATISPTGIVTPNNVGFDIVHYTVGGCAATPLPITIYDTALPITGPNTFCQDSTVLLVDGVSGGTWSSSNPAIATITSSGILGFVNAAGHGIDTISYSMPYCPVHIQVLTVNPTPLNITGSTAICVGLGTVLSDATPGGLWTSNSPAVSVSPTGVVTCSVIGASATIAYTLPITGCKTTAVVNAGAAPNAIRAKDTVCQGASVTIPNTDPAHSGVWSSTHLAIAQVIDSSGVVTGISAGHAIISYTWPDGCYTTDSFTVMPPVPGSVTITGPVSPVCSGTLENFIANPINGGTSPTYIWKLFGSSLLPASITGDTLPYRPNHGDVVMVYMYPHGICAAADSVVDTFAVDVYPDLVFPVVSITTANPDSITYIGEIITFIAEVTWGGTLLTYQWGVNRVDYPGATSPTFALPVYGNDSVYCKVTGTPPCPGSEAGTTSDTIRIYANYLGVNGLSKAGALSLYPNPNTGTFTLNGAVDCKGCKEVNYDVINVLGQVVYSGVAIPQNGQINQVVAVGNQASGSYMLRVNTETGNELFHFVINK